METSIVVPTGKQENIIEMSIIQRIHEIRGVRVILDFDLAKLYEVETKNLNLSVKRNLRRFPPDFMFQLTSDEWNSLRLQNETSKRGGRRYMPYAFTEQGIAMLSGLLNSEIAIDTNIVVMRAFVILRQYVLNYAELNLKIEKLTARLDDNDVKTNEIFALLKELLEHKKELEKPRNRIGFETGANS
jgi:hypothetical protein